MRIVHAGEAVTDECDGNNNYTNIIQIFTDVQDGIY